MEKKVWLITGCSTGFGRHLSQQLLEAGHKVVVTARNTENIKDLVEISPENAIAVRLDVTKQGEIADAVKAAKEQFGRIDVLINNAGFGYFGSAEESDDAEVRAMFEANFWGLANMTRAILPMMREQKSGVIVNISSIGGFVGYPSLSYYNATKFAVNGFTEALQKEVAPLGIKVISVLPSGFRTDWAGRSANDAESTISDYKETSGANQATIRGYSGNQPGDPVRAAKAIIDASLADDAPSYLLLGKAAYKNANIKLADLSAEFAKWQSVSEGADFPDAELAAGN